MTPLLNGKPLSFPKGITTQVNKLKKKVNIGAKINKTISQLLGNIVSFTNNFKPSDNGCNNPKVPTTFGPFLLWIEDKIFLSAKVK